MVFGGRRWIRTTEVVDNRFTVCPLWPLGNSPISIQLKPANGRNLALQAFCARFCNLRTSQLKTIRRIVFLTLLTLSGFESVTNSIFGCGAGGRTRTPDLLITNQLLYQLSYTSVFR